MTILPVGKAPARRPLAGWVARDHPVPAAALVPACLGALLLLVVLGLALVL